MTSPIDADASSRTPIDILATGCTSAPAGPAATASNSRLIVGTANSQTTNTTNSSSLPTIRTRTRAGVPPLELALRDANCLRPEHVVFDRLAYHVEVPITFPSVEALNEFVELVADPLIHDRPFWNLRTTPIASAGGASSVKFTIAEGWHVAGKAEVRLNRSLQGRLAIDLDLNYGRWAGALAETDPAILADIRATEVLLNPGSRRRGTLDGRDNVLPHRNRVGSPSDEPRVTHFVELAGVYLSKTEELLRHFLVGRPDYPMPAGMHLTAPILRGASCAEAYFEFYAEDAIATVERLRGAALAGMSDPEWRYFRTRSVDGAISRNSPSVTIPLTKTVGVTVYAKQRTTIRVEARYHADIRENAFHRSDRGGVRTPTAELAGLRHDAANRIRGALAAFAVHLRPTNTRRDAFDLLHLIYEAVGHDRDRARALSSALRTLGGVTVTDDDGIAPPAVIRSLEQAGVIHRVPYRHGNADPVDQRRYALTPSYAAAVQHTGAAAQG